MTDMTIPAPQVPTGGRRRLPVIGVGLLIAAALAALYVFVLSPLLVDEPPADPPVAELPPTQPADAEAIAADAAGGDGGEAAEAAGPPESSQVLAARDPFQQLVTDEPVAAAAPATTTAAEASAAAAPDTIARDTTALPATRVGSTVVRVAEVGRVDGVERATVTVNGEDHIVTEGQAFATGFRLLDISGDCVTLSFAERRFTLCAGEEITK